MHQTILLLYFSSAIKKNELANDSVVQSILYSMIPTSFHASYNFVQQNATIDLDDDSEEVLPDFYCIKSLITWFNSQVALKDEESPNVFDLTIDHLIGKIKSKKLTVNEYEIACVALCRSFGLTVRIVQTLNSYLSMLRLCNILS